MPRVLPTELWVPAGRGPFPLVVFAHGYDITPKPYAPLLADWARAGFVVAAPVFPRTNPRAPGGPDENDILNQPGDMSAVITWLLGTARRPGGLLSGRLEGRAVAVAGQSDGAITALLAADNRHFVDRRVRAAIVMSGAILSSLPGYEFGPSAPPLLVTQGTADEMNLPRYGYGVFDAAARAGQSAFLLRLLGAGHLPPYTTEQPQLGVVERVTADFLRLYLSKAAAGLSDMRRDGDVPGVAALSGRP